MNDIFLILQNCGLSLELMKINERLNFLDNRITDSKTFKKKHSLYTSFVNFLKKLPGDITLSSCSPNDVRKYLVWKDQSGKTIVHTLMCPYLGSNDKVECGCPKRLSSGTVENIIQQLCKIFEDTGFGRSWDLDTKSGNPATAPIVKQYLKLIREEQAKSHVLPKQAKPLFIGKLRSISQFIKRELDRPDLTLRERFVLSRDQALFKIQFFSGDRAGDLALVVSQEVKLLNDESGFAFNHTFGKTLRGGNGKKNAFVVKRCEDKIICPVLGLQNYFILSKSMDVDLSCGYLFRIVSENGRVLDKAVTYSVIYERLKMYLSNLGIYEGETPHSLRAGCAIFMALSGSANNITDMMEHIGWFSEKSAEYYSRLPILHNSGCVASNMAKMSSQSDIFEAQYKDVGDLSSLKCAFTSS